MMTERLTVTHLEHRIGEYTYSHRERTPQGYAVTENTAGSIQSHSRYYCDFNDDMKFVFRITCNFYPFIIPMKRQHTLDIIE